MKQIVQSFPLLDVSTSCDDSIADGGAHCNRGERTAVLKLETFLTTVTRESEEEEMSRHLKSTRADQCKCNKLQNKK